MAKATKKKKAKKGKKNGIDLSAKGAQKRILGRAAQLKRQIKKAGG